MRSCMYSHARKKSGCSLITYTVKIAGLACCTNFVGTIEEGWEMTSDPLTKWQMLILRSRQFVWRDKDDFSMSSISDPLCFEGCKVASHWINQGSMFDVWTSADDCFQHRQSSQVSLWLAWLARWLRRLPCRFTAQDKSVRKNIFLRISLIKSFDALCKVVQSLIERSEQPEISAKFLRDGADCYVVSWIASSIASDGGPVFKIAGLASGTTFVGTTGEGWVAYFIRIRCSLFPSFQGQHIWCLNLCRWAPLTQAESQSESETSNTCQMAEEIEMSFDCGFQLVQVCQNPSLIKAFFWFFVQSFLYSFFLTDVKNPWVPAKVSECSDRLFCGKSHGS